MIHKKSLCIDFVLSVILFFTDEEEVGTCLVDEELSGSQFNYLLD